MTCENWTPSLWRTLIGEYLEVKPSLVANRMTPNDMTARQQVGLYLKSFGGNALVTFRSLPRDVQRGYQKQWPEFEGLLEQCIQEGPGNPMPPPVDSEI
jgi:hypothetical protein